MAEIHNIYVFGDETYLCTLGRFNTNRKWISSSKSSQVPKNRLLTSEQGFRRASKLLLPYLTADPVSEMGLRTAHLAPDSRGACSRSSMTSGFKTSWWIQHVRSTSGLLLSLTNIVYECLLENIDSAIFIALTAQQRPFLLNSSRYAARDFRESV